MELGLLMTDVVKMCNKCLSDLQNIQRATNPIYYKHLSITKLIFLALWRYLIFSINFAENPFD